MSKYTNNEVLEVMARKTKEKLSICSFLLSSSSFLPTLLFFSIAYTYILGMSKQIFAFTLCIMMCTFVWCRFMSSIGAVSKSVCSEVKFTSEKEANNKKMKRNNKIANDKIKHAYLWRKKRQKNKKMCVWV